MNDWPVAFMLVSGVHKPHCKRPHFLLAQQGQPGSLTGRMPDFRVRLAGWLAALNSPSLFQHGSPVSQLSLSVAMANEGVCADHRGHWSPSGHIQLLASALFNIYSGCS